jgi:ferredoxin-NADP reductase
MARAALSGRLTWQLATVREVVVETAGTRTIAFDVPDWPGHLAGQHIDVRLTAEDGYQALRSYSIASAPEDAQLAITVERIDDGEVSPYLVDELRAGDEIELRGPVGGYFVWERSVGGPLLLLAGGSGIVPLRAMLRHHAASGSDAAVRLIYSTRSPQELIYRDELDRLSEAESVDVRLVLTRRWPEDWSGHRGRINHELLRELAWPPGDAAHIYVCGPSGFVETMSQWLVRDGHHPASIRTERFGPSGT